MPRYLVSIDHQDEGRVEECRVDADSPVQAAYQVGIKIGMESREDYNETVRLVEIIAVNRIVETFDKEWAL